MKKKGLIFLAVLWTALTLLAWFGSKGEFSDAERRQLAQFPELTADTVLRTDFMTNFEDYTLDQFPLRDSFRQLKALFHYNLLGQKDNNDIYVVDGSAAKLEYPLNHPSVNYALERFDNLYQKYLKDGAGSIYAAIVPDKGYYLAAENGYPALDYEALFAAFEAGMPWAEFVDLTDCLDGGDYYRTDTHWRQEALGEAARRLCDALGVRAFDDLSPRLIEKPFYGVYYGQAALPMEPDELYVMTNQVLESCTVFNTETGKEGAVYDLDKLESRDLYDVFLSGAAALLTIENPGAATDKELIVFRDSFGSSMVPLLVRDYRTVTVVDIRYLASDYVGTYVDFHGQDVLLLYSTLILNQADTMK